MRAAIFVLILPALLVPVAVVARDEETPPTRAIRYRDLDLRTEVGVRHLHERVNYAAIAVCAESGFYKAGAMWSSAARECQQNAVAAVEPRLQLAVAKARNLQVASVDLGTLSVGGASGR